MSHKLEPGRHKEETSMEYLRRVVNNMDMETESLLDALPSVNAVLEYFGLWETYDTDFMQGIEEGIEEGDDPAPLKKFIAKHKLDWDTDWIK